ncbi:hypothetical protein CHS0354_042673 [Potamilus streckersoni]|uniref:FHA domain-containing protein n=1 Tax=Potamilus streckersoni TaxID=2493646 RepID=A0AAE0TE28_9BIVA|nr:hypothetical protein CHS0354_042673 [Potamilus streckersoni]
METRIESSTLEEKNSAESKGASLNALDNTGFKTPAVSMKSSSKSKPSIQDAHKTDQNPPDTTLDSSTKEFVKEPEFRDSKQNKLSPAEQLKQSQVAVPYKEPPWGGLAEQKYSFEIIKNGAVTGTVEMNDKAFYIFGRLPSCDVQMEHPSLSRYHAIVQYCASPMGEYEKGWYLYDLDSTHGTWINKYKVKSNVYQRLRVGHVVKFGGSTRLYILQGPDEDKEEESELTVAELREQREKQNKEAELLRQAELMEEERSLQDQRQREEEMGCTWGMDEVVVDEDEEDEEIPTEMGLENESLYIDDPKKALKGFFEREGYDTPEYQFADASHGKRRCYVELPIDTPTGEPMVAEVVLTGKKKDAVVACALEACRILDKQGLLRASKHESRKKKKRNWEDDDFYDSEEDTYLDRTGTIEKKRQMRMKQSGKDELAVETYDSLVEKHTAVIQEIETIQAKLDKAKADAAAYESEEVDALDAYMSAIKGGVMDTKTKMKLKRQLMELKQEEMKLSKLVKIAKPASMPGITSNVQSNIPSKSLHTRAILSVGKMKGFDHSKQARKPSQLPIDTTSMMIKNEDFVEEEEEEEENDNEAANRKPENITSENKHVEKTLPTKSSVTPKNNDLTNVTCNTASIFMDKIHLLDSSVKNEVDSKSSQHASGTMDKIVDTLTASSKRSIRGPTLPLAAVLQKLQEEAGDSEEIIEEENIQKKDSRKRSRPVDIQKVEIISKKQVKVAQSNYDSTDPDYATWVPPQNQSGDGKTHLNAKYGY